MKIIRRQFRYRNDNVVYYIIGFTFLIYLAQMVLVYIPVINLPIVIVFSMNPNRIIHLGWYWQFFTYMFIHSPQAMSHILFNMFALFIFGRQVEWRMGSREFLMYYFVTGTLAGIFSFFVYYLTGQTGVYLMGASGAIFAVQLAYAAFFPDSTIYIWGILPIKAPLMVLGFAGLEIFFMFTRDGSNVAHGTHLAGFAFGWLYFTVRFGINPWKSFRRR